MPKRRIEVSTVGANEANQGLTTDPILPSSNPTSLGLRVPPCLPGVAVGMQPRYLFLLASRKISRERTTVRGIRLGATIGVNISSGSAALYPEEFLITSPYWSFVDGNISWHLVREPAEERAFTRPKTDGPSWAFKMSDTPAMLYNNFQNSNVNPTTGAPYYYNVGLTAYDPPKYFGAWQPIAGLGNMKDMRFPWNAPTEASAINEEVEGTCRISLYASVLQTNPATRAQASIPAAANVLPGGLTPESAFLNSIGVGEGGPTAIYWRVFGTILFEDDVADVSKVGT